MWSVRLQRASLFHFLFFLRTEGLYWNAGPGGVVWLGEVTVLRGPRQRLRGRLLLCVGTVSGMPLGGGCGASTAWMLLPHLTLLHRDHSTGS